MNESKLKILIYTHEFPPMTGGVASYNCDLAEGLHHSGHQVMVLTLADKDAASFDQAQGYGIQRMPISRKFRRWTFAYYILSGLFLLVYLRRFKPDRLLVTHHPAHLCTTLVLPLVSLRPFVTVHGREIEDDFINKVGPKACVLRFLMRQLLNRSSAVIAVSNSTCELLKKVGVPESKLRVIYHGIRREPFLEKPYQTEAKKKLGLDGSHVILTLGRVIEGKGLDVMVEIFPKVLERVPNVKYIVVGGGPFLAPLRRLISEKGLEEHIFCYGPVPRNKAVTFYDGADLFVLLSTRGKRESFGIVLIEAGARKLPSVASRVGGIPEVILDGETGYLVDPFDQNQVVERITDLLSKRQLSTRQGINARHRVEQLFTTEIMVRNTEMLLINPVRVPEVAL